MLGAYGYPDAQPSKSASPWDDLPDYEEYVAAGRSERQDLGACVKCGIWARGLCVDCQEPVCEKHSRTLDGRLRCGPDAAAYEKHEPPRLEAEATARREEERRWLADVERARKEREAEKRAESDRRSQMPVLRGQHLADFLSGRTDEWVVGRVGDTDGVALAEALKLAGVPPIRISIRRKPGFFKGGKARFCSEQGWLIKTTQTTEPDPSTIYVYLLTDGRGLSVNMHYGSYEQSPTYSAPTVRSAEYRLRLEARRAETLPKPGS